jgi:hypothetical protein
LLQLLHVKSGKFLTIIPDQLARDERENIRISLSAQGNSYSWLQILPRYKIDREGDRILSNTEVLFKVADRPNEFLHCSEKDPPNEHSREVNCSLETSSWKLALYQNVKHSVESLQLLCCSQLVIIHDPESHSNVTLCSPVQIVSTLTDDGDYPPSSATSPALAAVPASPKSLRHVKSSNKLQFIEAADKVTMVPVQADSSSSSIDTNAIWVMESADRELCGGPVALKTDLVRFRNLNNGKYLALETSSASASSTEQCAKLTVKESLSSSRTLFGIHEVYSSGGNYLSHGKPVQLHQEGLWLQKGEYDEEMQTYSCIGAKDKALAFNFLINRYAEKTKNNNNGNGSKGNHSSGNDKNKNASDISNPASSGSAVASSGSSGSGASPASSGHGSQGADLETHRGAGTTTGGVAGGTVEEPLDVYIGVAIRNLIRKYLNRTVVPLRGEENLLGTLWPNFDRRTELAFFEKLMKKVIQFIQGYPLVTDMTVIHGNGNGLSNSFSSLSLSSLSGSGGMGKPSQSLIAYRQSMICDQGTLRLLMMFIEKLIPISIRTDSTISSAVGIHSNATHSNSKTAQSGGRGGGVKSEEEKIVISMGQTILHLILTFLYYATLNNSKNQMVVGDAMPILLAHVGAQPLASKCVTDMLNSNMDLQEKKIGAREISIFTDKLRASKMNSMYLNLLRACCSCQGRGVTHNQTIVTEVVFKDFNDIIIQIHSDHAKTVKVDWLRGNGGTGSSLFIPQKIEPTSPVMGVSLLKKGLPHLSLSWTTNSIDFSPLGLFGKLSVPIIDLYGTEASTAIATASGSGADTSKRNANKIAVAEYFIAELFLSADMCLGRNYHAIHKLEELFSYDTLVTILRMNDITEHLKSAVVKLLLRLYVDRDPQVISSVPCLTRTWSEVCKQQQQQQDQGDSPSSASSGPQLPHVDVSRENQFCLLQQIISEEIQSMRGTRWDGLSLHMMELLNKLIIFNFYGTTDKIQDVIGPLLQALDRRKVEGSGPQDKDIMLSTDLSYTAMGMGGTGIMKQTSKQNIKRSQSFKDAKIIPEGGTGAGTTPGATETSLSADVDRLLDSSTERGPCWQKTVLDALESITAVILIVFLVLLAISVTIATTISGSQNPAYGYFDIVVTSIFATEVTTRFYCHVYVRRNVMSFLSSPLNWVDMGTVAVDLIILATPGLSGSGAEYTKALRAVRLVRLVRLFRAARLVQKLKDLAGIRYPEWKMPVRYNRCPGIELETMVEAVNILAYIERIIEDRNLSLLLKGFHQWESSLAAAAAGSAAATSPSAPVSAAATEAAIQIFKSVVTESKALTLGNADGFFDDIFVDNIMLPSNALTQGLLNVLMTHHSSTRMLLENAKAVQLLVSKKRERQYRNIDHHLLDLERYAGTNDIWGSLQSEADQRVNKIVRDILKDLLDYCRVRCTVLQFDQEFEPDVVIQDLLRNLGFYDIAFKILRLLDEIDEELNPIQATNNKEIIALCNELLYWFALDNPPNQSLLFAELEFFLETIEFDIGSHRVITAIFRNNESLMKSCPRGYIEQFAEKICHLGQEYGYPYLTFMSAITNAGEKNVLENQYEIVKQLIAPARLHQLSSFCCPITDSLYQEKVQLMAPFLSSPNDIAIEDLPPRLAYHLEFLRILSGCTVGRNNITTVEAKVQSVFAFADIIDAILDKRSLQIVNIQLGATLYNCMLDVEINIPGMAQSARMWNLIEHCLGVFEAGLGKLRRIEKEGSWEAGAASGGAVKRQDLEWLVTCITIVYGFFNFTYDPTKIKSEDGSGLGSSLSLVSQDTVSLDMTQVTRLISNLFQLLKAMHDLNSTVLQKAEKELLIQTLEVLNRHSAKVYFDSIEELYEETEEKEKQKLLEMSEEGIESFTLEEKISLRYQEFLRILESSEEVTEITLEENRAFIRRIEKLPFVNDTSKETDVRYEPFIQKLVSHVRERLTVNTMTGEKFLDSQCVLTTIWLIRSFRTMIENRWGMTIYERDEDGGEKEDQAAAPVVNALNSCGATTLCLDLISVGIDSGLMIECVKLCVAMLFKEGGNLTVQQTMFDYLNSHDSELFFKQMRISLQKLIAWHRWHDIIILPSPGAEDSEGGEKSEVELPEEIVIVRFLQLMCEGHYQPNQDILREQPANTLSVNLLDDFVAYLNCVSRLPCRTSTNAASRVSATILEVIQGPCEKNQIHFVMSTELIETLNRVMRSKPVRDCKAVEEYELKKTGIDILQGLLEGQGGKKTVYERVLSVLHLDIIQMLCAVDRGAGGAGGEGDEEEEEEEENAIAMLQTESLVLLQMFCDYKPSLRNEMDFLKDSNGTSSSLIGSEVACVEILWRGDLQRRFFHVPKICADLAKASKDNLVEEVDRSNLETKLQDFIARAHELYREVTHQQVLKRWRISGIFSRANQNRATWISFSFTCIINLFMLGFYDASTGTPLLPKAVRVVVDALNIMQLASATFTLLLYLIVRAPVKFEGYVSEGYSTLLSVLYTSTDGMTVYYFIYVIVCGLAINVSDILLTFLLLDIVVKNSTTRDVLYSVINPRKQLAMTVLLGVFVIYIFSFFIVSTSLPCPCPLFSSPLPPNPPPPSFPVLLFLSAQFYNFRGEMLDGLTKKDCSTLWKCFQFSVGYGLRFPNGVSEQMNHTLGDRYPVDVLYFLVVLVVLLNVVFGIIIDTFGNLRNKKIQRLIDTTEKCFICGIDKQIFDRSSLQPNGFKTHITADHNMWNYLAFIVCVLPPLLLLLTSPPLPISLLLFSCCCCFLL